MLRSRLAEGFHKAAERAFGLTDLPPAEIFRPRDPARGDFGTQWPLRLAGRLGRSPEAVALALASVMPPDAAIREVVPAGGYLNVRLSDEWLCGQLADWRADGAKLEAAGTWPDPFKPAGDPADEEEDAESFANPRFRLAYAQARLASLLRLAAAEGLGSWRPGDALDWTDPLAREVAIRALTLEADAEGQPATRVFELALALADAFQRYYARAPLFGQPADLAAHRMGLIRGTFLALATVYDRERENPRHPD